MCGIVGVIGKSKNPGLSMTILTTLIEETESRGSDASGFYAVNDEGLYYDFFKNNIPPTVLMKSKAWKELNPDLTCLIAHARMKTHGTEIANINNHPHISENNLLALVHNGVINNFQGIAQRNNLKLLGQCDSEVLLKFIEAKEDPDQGVKNIFQEMKHSMGSFACLAIDNRKEPLFYAFRNNISPICFIDMSEALGQYFFCSTSQLWTKTLNRLNLGQFLQIPAVSVPSYEVWKITPDLEITKTKMSEFASMTVLGNDFPDDEGPWWSRRIQRIRRIPHGMTLSSMHDGLVIEEDDEPENGIYGSEFESVQEVGKKITDLKAMLDFILGEMQTRSYTHSKVNYENLTDELDGMQQALEAYFIQEQLDFEP